VPISTRLHASVPIDKTLIKCYYMYHCEGCAKREHLTFEAMMKVRDDKRVTAREQLVFEPEDVGEYAMRSVTRRRATWPNDDVRRPRVVQESRRCEVCGSPISTCDKDRGIENVIQLIADH
jgi:hypothetical protein